MLITPSWQLIYEYSSGLALMSPGHKGPVVPLFQSKTKGGVRGYQNYCCRKRDLSFCIARALLLRNLFVEETSFLGNGS